MPKIKMTVSGNGDKIEHIGDYPDTIYNDLFKDMDSREKSIAEIEIIKSWYLKRWISLREYSRLTDLIF